VKKEFCRRRKSEYCIDCGITFVNHQKHAAIMLKHIFIGLLLGLSYNAYTQCWNLVWADEFNGTALDLSKWSYQTGGDGWGNNELQHYTNRVDNCLVSGGTLKMIVKEEAYSGNNYTSARIRSLGKADFRYGKIEMYAKLPETQSLWPAFWMLPSENVFGTWPAGGEIDIMELLGQEPALTYGTIHTQNPATGGVISSSSTYTLPTGTFASGFHVFRIEWEPTAIRWYIDNTLYATKTPAQLSPWRFTEFFHIILNVAVGGNWPGPPNTSTIFPQQMEVDYVRVYQQTADITITGQKKVEPNASATYTMPTISGATYTWTPPSGAAISSGQGTPQASIQFGTQSGNISCTITTSCGTAVSNKSVEITANMLTNQSFEDDFGYWVTNLHSGSGAFSSVGISSSTPQHLTKKACATVNQIPTNFWDIQINQLSLHLVAGQSYTLKFWAQSDAPNKTIGAALINSSTFLTYHIQSFNIGTAWQQYMFTFTAAATANAQLNFDFGYNTGTFCIDNVLFGKTAFIVLAVEITDFDAQITDHNNAQITWSTAQQRDIAHYTLERSSDAVHFDAIYTQKIVASESARYTYLDRNLDKGTWYYRLVMHDLDGKTRHSHAVGLQVMDDYRLSVFPNPNTGYITVTQNGKQFSDHNLLIFNSIGQLVQQEELQNASSNIDLSNLPSGVYQIRVGEQRVMVVRK
jgi:beta-glucanase (GH16 family)